MKNRKFDGAKLIKKYPKIREDLPKKYKEICQIHYFENRNAKTQMSRLSMLFERWMHKKVAKKSFYRAKTLEIGAGTLNQIPYEKCKEKTGNNMEGGYDIVEPKSELYENSEYINFINNKYRDIKDICGNQKYDRIISIACFEHIEDLPDVIKRSGKILKKDGVMQIAIPNEGRFLWRFAYTISTGLEFRRRYGLDYNVIMKYVHINNADEIDCLLRYYFKKIKCQYCGCGKTFSLYRYYECREFQDRK